MISRCISRLFLLAPSYEVTQTFLYVLGHYAKKHGITLYALVLMANHYHLLGLDKHGNLPHFMRDLNSFVARVLNHGYGRDDKFWTGDGYHIVRPINPEDVWARLMYITSNPINADLVVRTQDYPGFVTGRMSSAGCHRSSVGQHGAEVVAGLHRECVVEPPDVLMPSLIGNSTGRP